MHSDDLRSITPYDVNNPVLEDAGDVLPARDAGFQRREVPVGGEAGDGATTPTRVRTSDGSRPYPEVGVDFGLQAKVLAWLQHPALRAALGVFVLTRVLFGFLTYFGVILFRDQLHAEGSSFYGRPSFVHAFLPAWTDRWDAVWYAEIAQRGYHWMNPAGTSPTAFFPLYPLLIRIGGTITHRSYGTVALVIANLCFFAALIYLWRLATWEFDRSSASRAVLYISVFPTALFFFAGYTESLFLFLSVACFFHMRRRDWLLAGVFGAFASATRVAGVLLILPFVYEYFRSINFSPRRLDRGVLGLALIPVGLLAFMVYLGRVVGDPIAFAHHQAAWQKIFTLRIWAGFAETLRQIFIAQPIGSFFAAHNVMELLLGGGVLVASILAARRLPASYTLYVAVFWLVTLTSPALAHGYPVPLISLSRYVLALFPVFIYLGVVGRERRIHDTYLILATGLLAVFTVQFLNNGWII